MGKYKKRPVQKAKDNQSSPPSKSEHAQNSVSTSKKEGDVQTAQPKSEPGTKSTSTRDLEINKSVDAAANGAVTNLEKEESTESKPKPKAEFQGKTLDGNQGKKVNTDIGDLTNKNSTNDNKDESKPRPKEDFNRDPKPVDKQTEPFQQHGADIREVNGEQAKKQVADESKKSSDPNRKINVVPASLAYDPSKPMSDPMPGQELAYSTQVVKTLTFVGSPVSEINASIFKMYKNDEGFLPLPIRPGFFNVLTLESTPLYSSVVQHLFEEYDIPPFQDQYGFFKSYLAWVLASISIHDGIRTNIEEMPNPVDGIGKLPLNIGIPFMAYSNLFTADVNSQILEYYRSLTNKVINAQTNTGKYISVMHPASYNFMLTLHNLQLQRLISPLEYFKYFSLTNSEFNIVPDLPDLTFEHRNYWVGSHNIHFQMYDGSPTMLSSMYTAINTMVNGFVSVADMDTKTTFGILLRPLAININTLSATSTLGTDITSSNGKVFFTDMLTTYLLSDFYHLLYNPFKSNISTPLDVLDCILAPIVVKQSLMAPETWTRIHNYVFNYLVLPLFNNSAPSGYTTASAEAAEKDYLIESFNEGTIYIKKPDFLAALKNHFGYNGDGDYGSGNGSAHAYAVSNTTPLFKEGRIIFEPLTDANFDERQKLAVITKLTTLRQLAEAMMRLDGSIAGINAKIFANLLMSIALNQQPYTSLQYYTHVFLRAASALPIVKPSTDYDYRESNSRLAYYAEQDALEGIQTYLSDSSFKFEKRVFPLTRESFPSKDKFTRYPVEVDRGAITAIFKLVPSGLVLSTNLLSQMKSSLEFTYHIYEFSRMYSLYRLFFLLPPDQYYSTILFEKLKIS